MILGILGTAVVLSVLIYLIAGEASLPGLRELAVKVLIASVAVNFVGFFLDPVNIVLSIIARFVVLTLVLSILLRLDFKQMALICAIQQALQFGFSLFLRYLAKG